MKPLVTVIRAGSISYTTGLHLQTLLAAQPSEAVPQFRNYLVLQEHNPPAYTIGIRTKGYGDDDAQRLRQLGAEFHRTNRGGLITYHGPGQLVAYPILHLRQFQPSIRWFVQALERTVIAACKEMGVVEATTTTDTGIWVGQRKICAIGVHGSRYVTTHGIGLNCCTDLSWFEHIIPCGITGKGVTSLTQELQRNVSVAEGADFFVKNFAKVFDCGVQEGQTENTSELIRQAEIGSFN